MREFVSLTEGLLPFPRSVGLGPYPLVADHTIPCEETAQLEADAFVRRQRVGLAAEVKAVLDSLVYFEQQEKENKQAQLAKSVVNNVTKNILEKMTQRDVLAWAVSELSMSSSPFPPISIFLRLCRTSQKQGDLTDR
jgi:Mitochondrial ATP synthase B chain precursor (ATP-synt_B)